MKRSTAELYAIDAIPQSGMKHTRHTLTDICCDVLLEIQSFMASWIELYCFSRTCKLLFETITVPDFRKLVLQRLTKMHIPNPEEFLEFVRISNSWISGSLVLGVLWGQEWEDSDIDVFCHYRKSFYLPPYKNDHTKWLFKKNMRDEVDVDYGWKDYLMERYLRSHKNYRLLKSLIQKQSQ